MGDWGTRVNVAERDDLSIISNFDKWRISGHDLPFGIASGKRNSSIAIVLVVMEEIIDEMCQRGRWRHADVKGFIDVIICRADACAAIGQVDRVVGLHILIICVVNGAKVQKNNQLCKFLGGKLHKFLRIHKERGDSFEPHLFYFLDLSQEETCCVLIPAGTIVSYPSERLFLIL